VSAEAAWAAAASAATASGVEIRLVSTVEDIDAIDGLLTSIWGSEPTNPPITKKLMRALTKAGNYVAGAYDAAGIVGACVGFFGPPPEATLYSQIAGVAAPGMGRAVGYAMKLHQRAWAIERGARAITWTFDPLVARNAYFNLVKLGARPIEYLESFYGAMTDEINRGQDSDRLFLRWDLESDLAVAAVEGRYSSADAEAERAGGAAVALSRGEHGEPQVHLVPPGTGTILVAVPADVEALRVSDPGTAADWRLAVRAVLGAHVMRGARVTGFDRSGWYVVADNGGAE
jgi:predicted GNAT superfamily acetyltransferase